VLLPVCFGILLPGCHDDYPEELEYHFSAYPEKVNREGQEVKELFDPDPETKATVTEQLKGYFGTPRSPLLEVDPGLQKQLLITEALEEAYLTEQRELSPEAVLAHGSSLYRRLCLYCHGLVGDGNGPTALYLQPRPRDFRQGKFKFRSTARQSSGSDPNKVTYDTSVLDAAPSREDLKRTLRAGMPTANMPSFNLLEEADLDALVSYVIHLSLRGKAEYQTTKYTGRKLQTWVPRLAKEWLADMNSTYVPQVSGEEVWATVHREGVETNYKQGREIYEGVGGCVECHGKDGRAGRFANALNDQRRNDWGDLNAPRDLSLGWFRGGSRPIDVFYRIKLGIAGSGMPAANDQKVTDKDIWYMVDYVLSLPQQR
jgi:mono/diheme cytochrome c family protein